MSFEERNAVNGILICFVTWAVMIAVLLQKSNAGLFDGVDGPQQWAQAVLWLMLIGLAIGIAMFVASNVIYALITGEKKAVFLRDERDDMIGLRGAQATMLVFVAGFFAALVALAFGTSIIKVLNIILLAGALSSFASDVTKLYFYRRGF